MKIVPFIISILFSLNCFSQIYDVQSQNSNFPKEVQEFRDELEAAFGKNDQILIPYFENNKWGYLDSKTLRKLTSAKANWLKIANSDSKELELGSMEINNTNYLFSVVEKTIKVERPLPPTTKEMLPEGNWKRPTEFFVEVIEDYSFRGFSYVEDREGKLFLSSYSSAYKSGNKHFPNLTPIQLGDNVVAIAGLYDSKANQYKEGIIFPDGKAMNGFDFNFKSIKPILGTKLSLGSHFLVQKVDSIDENYYIANSKGEILNENVLPKLNYRQNYYLEKNATPYLKPYSTLGYAINEGILIDLYLLKKVPNISSKLIVTGIDYFLKGIVNTNDLEELRKNSIVYILVSESEESIYYRDLKGTIFKPKNK